MDEAILLRISRYWHIEFKLK